MYPKNGETKLVVTSSLLLVLDLALNQMLIFICFSDDIGLNPRQPQAIYFNS